MTSSHCIRQMTANDFDFALCQTSREGWGVPREVFELCLAHDPNSTFVMQQGDELFGLVTAICYVETAWIGHLIVSPEHRYQGLGAALMVHAIQHVKSKGIDSILLDADPPGIKLYKRLGFSHVTDSLRFAGQIHGNRPDERPQPIQPADLVDLTEFDRQHFGDDRQKMLRLLLRYATAAYLIRNEKGIVGYGMTWSYDSSVRLGPIVATDETIARSIIASLTHSHDDSTTFTVGLPATSVAGVALYESLKMQQTPASFRMILSTNVRPPSAHIYAIANGAIG